MSIFKHYKTHYDKAQQEEFSLQNFLNLCRENKMAYVSVSERLLKAIGKPEMIDTSKEPSLSRIFSNRVIERYPVFKDFYGIPPCQNSCHP